MNYTRAVISSAVIFGAVALVAVAGVGCANKCEKLAAKVCDRALEDLEACESIPADSKAPGNAREACVRMQAVVAGCRSLKQQAPQATPSDLRACAANLELVRSLEKAKQ